MKLKFRFLAVALLTFFFAGKPAAAGTYVALGDSLAFGFQEYKFLAMILSNTYSPSGFNTGFVDDLGMILNLTSPGTTVVNLSCPGETTGTFIAGGCPFHNVIFNFALHNNYPPTQPQSVAALNYLQSHAAQVDLITVTLGANDILGLVSGCGGNPTCMQQQLPTVALAAAANLQKILLALRLAAPHATIAYTNVPDPYRFANPSTVPIFAAFNFVMSQTAAGMGVVVVDWFTPALSLTQSQFCAFDFVCTAPLYDIHPTDLGYFVLTQQVFSALDAASGSH